jgi:phage tail P2-like protein
MRLKDCEFEKLLPLFMRNQADDRAMAQALNETIRDIGEKAALCSDWGVIDELPEEFLDALAWELDIDWYDRTAEIEVKRALIKSSDIVHAHNGTKAAVARVVADYYGESVVEEWFEYGGQPGHFKVSVGSEDMHITIPTEFLELLDKVKRQSAVMDSVDFTWTTYETICTGTGQKQAIIQPDIPCDAGI